MNGARCLAGLLVMALVAPGLAAALPCGMSACEPAPRPAAHDCCPPALTELAAPCCEQSQLAPAIPVRSQERPEVVSAEAAVTGVAAALPAPLRTTTRALAAASVRQPLDSLAQSCILRI